MESKVMKKKVIIFGTGGMFEKVYHKIDFDKYEIVCFWDNNRKKKGLEYKGKIIKTPSKQYDEIDKIVVCSSFFEEIATQLITEYNVPECMIENYLYFTKCELLEYYNNINIDKIELKEIINYIENHPLEVFNYEFYKNYRMVTIEVMYDIENKMFYVDFMNNKMYFKRSLDTKEKVEKYYRFLLAEQDKKSPHCYFNFDLNITKDSIVVDAGVAEGNFALSIIDKVKKLILIEIDEEWIEALKITFAPWKEKVTIINKYLSDVSNETSITLDDINKTDYINLVKLDIEGYEIRALAGAKNLLLKQESFQLISCCYHYQNEENELKELLKLYFDKVEVSKGYMFFPYFNGTKYLNQTARLRRGLIMVNR